MNPILWTVFCTVFVAELGDKTQLATMMYASGKDVSRWTVFLGASAALVCSTLIGVMAGGLLSNIPPQVIRWVSGSGFVAVGLWTIFKGD